MSQTTIRPYPQNPFYWQVNDQPLLLLGGSVEDNLFQIDGLEAHLDLLKSVGGNYVRCTMSSRDPGDVWPFERDSDTGLYDLSRPGREYWRRFEEFLSLTDARGIIVQIEVWDRFDFARAPWQDNPFNPQNNANYTADESGLKTRIDTHPSQRESAFFRSVPGLDDNAVLLEYQRRHVASLLEISLQYEHVLYCIDNETNESPLWPRYWRDFINRAAQEAGREVYITEMWDDWDIRSEMHGATFNHPDLYGFIDISQNNQRPPQEHWHNLLVMRRRVQQSDAVRPMNFVKIYGATGGKYGSHRDGQERFWRGIFGGLAAVRFHRPESGLGLSEVAQANIRAARMLADVLPPYTCTPRPDLVDSFGYNDNYCLATGDGRYALFFPDGGQASLMVDDADTNEFQLRWLDIRAGEWHDPVPAEPVVNNVLRCVAPQPEGYFCAVVEPASS